MKFEDFLMQQREEQRKRLDLEDSVVKLQTGLEEEQKLNHVLKCALRGSNISQAYISSLLPPQVQVLLAEIALVEEEIISLERKIEELKICLHREKKQNKEFKRNHRGIGDVEQHPAGPSFNNAEFRSQRCRRERKASLGSASEIRTMSSTRLNDEIERSRSKGKSRNERLGGHGTNTENPNRLSEELIKCLIGIFLKMNRPSSQLNCEGSPTIPKLALSCMNSKGLVSKTTFNCKAPMFYWEENKSILDPYGIQTDLDGTVRDVGSYKNFIQFTRSSLEMSRVSDCFENIGKLRDLMKKLCTVDLSLLTYKQKLAFWINIYNGCIMHAFLQHGLPSTPDKLLALMNKAALNVGGIVLNALAIEHFIIRHPCESKNGVMDKKEMLLRSAYGLGYPEPNVTFALCRGSWSSPALRIYTAEDVVDELGRAKAEYLEASVGVTIKKKIIMPKLLHWHMQDFADKIESLLEWIYSQLPRSGSLKQLIMECLNGETKSSTLKMVEIQPYESEFRYLVSL